MDNSQNNFQNYFQPQQQQHYSNDNPMVTTLSIIGLVLAILTVAIAFIPCLGAFAFFIGVISLIISCIGLYLAYKNQVNKDMLIAALVISLVGTIISGVQLFTLKAMGDAIIENSQRIQNDSLDTDSSYNRDYDDD